MQKVLSVSVAAYNVEKFIEQCLDSFIDPAILDRVEVLVTDDGSKDRTPEIVSAYEKKHPGTFRLISQKNAGPGSTVNSGIKHATGKYFRMVDGDDWVNTAQMGAFLDILEKTNADMVCADHCCVDHETGQKKEEKTNVAPCMDVPFSSVCDQLTVAMHNVTYRTDILQKNNIHLDNCFYTDAEYLLYPIPYVKTVTVAPQTIYMYRVSLSTQSMNINSLQRNCAMHELVLGHLSDAYAAYESLSEINPYSIKDLKKFHGIMTKYLVEEYGEFRHGEEGVFNGDECIFMAPPAQFVPQLMDELFEWMKKSRNSVHPLIMSSVFHYEFVFIHPFADGNGRMARLWHTAILSKWKPVFEYIPIESRIEKFQDEYYDAIARCHVSGESTIFIEFMLSQIDRILEDISLQMNEENEQFSETVRKMLEIMEYDTPYTRKTLMEKLGLKSRDGFRRNYLQPALEMNLIQMTLPDKPNSRNQRYMKV